MRAYIVKVDGVAQPQCLATSAWDAFDITLVRVGLGHRISVRPAP